MLSKAQLAFGAVGAAMYGSLVYDCAPVVAETRR